MNSPNSQGNDVWVCDCAVCVARRLDEKKLTERTDAPSKPDPRRKDIGFDFWLGGKFPDLVLNQKNHDHQLWYSAEQLREAWIAGVDSCAVSETVPPKKGWPWKEGEVSIPAHILQQCEVWIGTAAHAGIQTKWFDGTDTPNRTQLLALHSALLALLNEPAAAAPSSTRPSHEDEDDFILRIAREVGMDPKPFTLTRWKDGIDIEYVIEHMKAFVRRVRADRSAIEPRIPVGWIARKDDGANLHFSVAQGWRIEEVLTVASTDGGRVE